MDPFDREPPHPLGEQVLTPVRLAATAAAALPAVGLGMLCIGEGLAEIGAPSLNCVFHLMLGTTLFVLFADVAFLIHSLKGLGSILLAGVLGFAGALISALLAEVFGPPILAVLLLVACGWAVAIARQSRVRPHLL